jgi:hypothetical protein
MENLGRFFVTGILTKVMALWKGFWWFELGECLINPEISLCDQKAFQTLDRGACILPS